MKLELTLRNKLGHEVIKIPVMHGELLLEGLKRNKVPISSSCGGNATCGTCKFKVLKGKSLPPESLEKELIDDRGFFKEERLSCQFLVISDLEIEIE